MTLDLLVDLLIRAKLSPSGGCTGGGGSEPTSNLIYIYIYGVIKRGSAEAYGLERTEGTRRDFIEIN